MGKEVLSNLCQTGRCRTESTDCSRKENLSGAILEHNLTAEYPREHEGKQAEIKNDTLRRRKTYTNNCYFTKKDYYWMGSNNTINFSDSTALWVCPQRPLSSGKPPSFGSQRKETGLFDGYRWNRFFFQNGEIIFRNIKRNNSLIIHPIISLLQSP